MKKNLLYLLLVALTAPLLHSCLDDDDDSTCDSLLAMGTVKVIEGRDYYFALDGGTTMYPGDTTYIHNYALNDGQRAFVHFIPLDEGVSGYDYNARILEIENILTKDIYFMPTEKADSIGQDPIDIISAWVKQDYLNIQFRFYSNPASNVAHMLNLVVDEAADTQEDSDGNLLLEFRHNAFTDTQHGTLQRGIVSFRLRNVESLLDGKNGITLYYKNLEEGESRLTATPDTE